MTRLADHLTYANVVSTTCLFVVLGGGAYAAARVTVPKHSVGAAQIKQGAVRSRQVKDGSLLAKDFKAGQLPAGKKGPRGTQGPQGPQGPRGPSGPSEAFHVTASTGPADIAGSPAYTRVLQLVLPPGSYVLSARVVATNTSTTTGTYVRCALFSDRDGVGADNYPVFVPPGGMQAIPLQGVRVVTGSSSTQYLECRKNANVTVSLGEDPQFTALKVGALSP
jgi:hypothetical protein